MGKEPFRFIPVEDMTKEHIQAVLDTQHQIPESIQQMEEFFEKMWYNLGCEYYESYN